jgi:hypothetical protein
MKNLFFLRLVNVILILNIPGLIIAQALKIDGNGNVAINGAPVASYNLCVHGKLRASEILVGKITSNELISNVLTIGSLRSSSCQLHIDVKNNAIGKQVTPSSNSTLKISGESNTYALYVDGGAYVTSGIWETSDGRMKKNIESIDGHENLNKLLQLQSKTYLFKSKEEIKTMCKTGELAFEKSMVSQLNSKSNLIKEEANYILPLLPKGKQYGLLAEEVEQIFPEFVMTDTLSETKAINYINLIPVLIEAVKEQQSQIKELNNRIEKIEKS